MGPRPFSRGNDAKGRPQPPHPVAASMGPRPFSRGNGYQAGASMISEETGLQWGHGLSAVEIMQLLARHRKEGAASMGPRPFSRGNPTANNMLPPRIPPASMGPRP